MSGFYLNQTNGKCQFCPKNCVHCDGLKCTECIDGFGINEKGECEKCPDNCLECTNSECSRCYDGYGFLHENGAQTTKCVACSVLDCQNRQYDSSVCTQCSDDDDDFTTGFINSQDGNTGQCEKCLVENCDECPRDSSICDSCRPKFALIKTSDKKNKCVPCIDNCRKCNDETTCRDCDYGYGLITNNGVQKCIKCEVENCNSCNDDVSKCNSCITSYEYDIQTNKCTLIHPNLKGCLKYYGHTRCLDCEDGYGQSIENGINTGICGKCLIENCANCWYSTEICVECLDGFGFSKDRDQCLKCEDINCQFCFADNKKCIFCKDQYCFNKNKDSSSYGKCIRCDGTEELECKVDGCEVCKEGTTDICEICKKPLSLVNGKCINQSSGEKTTSPSISHSPSKSPLPAPTKPPVETKNITIDDFIDKENQNKVNIKLEGEEYKDDVIYSMDLPKEINEVQLDSDKDVSLVLSEETTEITISSNTKKSNIVEIVPKSQEITINLDDNTKASISNAVGQVTLDNADKKQINLNQITPNSEDFVLVPKVPVKIDEVDFTGQQGFTVKLDKENNNVEVEKVKIQAHSTGTINNVAIKNIVLGPESSLNIAGNVDMSQSNIDLPYNDKVTDSDLHASFTGELSSTPANIGFNQRDFQYFDENTNERFLIAESSSSKFKCDEWATAFKKGPFNSKFNDAECKPETVNNENIKRLYAFVKENDKGKDNNNNKGLKPGEIAGIVIAAVVVVGAVIGILVYFLVIKKRKGSRQSTDQEEADDV